MSEPTTTTTPSPTTPPASSNAPTTGDTTVPGVVRPDGTKVIATPSYSKRVARDLAKLEKAQKDLVARQKELDSKTTKVKSYEDQIALVKAGKIKEFLQNTGLTREQLAEIYGFDIARQAGTGKELTPEQAKSVQRTTPQPAALSPEVRAIKEKLDALEKERADEKKEAAEAKKKAEEATFEANKNWFLDEIGKVATTATDDTYAFTALALKEDPESVREFMWDVVEAWCRANPTIAKPPPASEFAKAIEDDYEKEAARYSRVQKKAKPAVAATTPEITTTSPANTPALTPEAALRKLKLEWKAKSQAAVK